MEFQYAHQLDPTTFKSNFPFFIVDNEETWLPIVGFKTFQNEVFSYVEILSFFHFKNVLKTPSTCHDKNFSLHPPEKLFS